MRMTRLKYVSGLVMLVLLASTAFFASLRTLTAGDGQGEKRKGFQLFINKGCVNCHFTESRETKVGPGLKGLFERDTLPVSGREVTEANIKKQLTNPYRNMPSFAASLTEEQQGELVDYLKTL